MINRRGAGLLNYRPKFLRIYGLLLTFAILNLWPSRFASILVSAHLHSAVKIDCSKGIADPAISLANADKASRDCRKECNERCGSVTEGGALETCLADPALQGCLFPIARVIDIDVDDFCFTPTVSGGSSGPGRTLVFSVSDESLRGFGDGALVQAVSVAAKLKEAALGSGLSECGMHGVALGVSSLPFDAKSCAYEGQPLYRQRYSMIDNELVTNVTGLFAAAFEDKKRTTLFAQLIDASCSSKLAVEGLELLVLVKFDDGGRPSPSCKALGNQRDCNAAGCAFCSWPKSDREGQSLSDRKQAAADMPTWLPAWDVVDTDADKLCGLNSIICARTGGSTKDSVSTLINHPYSVLTLFFTLFFCLEGI